MDYRRSSWAGCQALRSRCAACGYHFYGSGACCSGWCDRAMAERARLADREDTAAVVTAGLAVLALGGVLMALVVGGQYLGAW